MAARRKNETDETPEVSEATEVSETPDSEKTKRTIAPEVPFALVAADNFEWAPVTSRGRPRSEYQQEMDSIVKNAFKGAPVALVVANDEAAITALERRVRNSGNHLKMGIRTGALQKGPNFPTDVVFMFKVEERMPKPRRKVATETEASDSENE